jgi:putative Mg2+ transporter-C (MgtC) family protein
MQSLPLLDVCLRIGCALVCGLVVGAERQWHQRTAGLRTYALVSVGAALFLLISSTSSDPSSQARIVGQIVTGIGFLGAGVMMRNPTSSSVKGLNTAATIWGISAVGCLAGCGLFTYAFLGTFSLLLINVFLRPLVDHINRRPEDEVEISVHYTIELRCLTRKVGHLRQLLTQLAIAPLHMQHLHSEVKGEETVVKALIGCPERLDSQIEHLSSRLALEPDVTSISWHNKTN